MDTKETKSIRLETFSVVMTLNLENIMTGIKADQKDLQQL